MPLFLIIEKQLLTSECEILAKVALLYGGDGGTSCLILAFRISVHINILDAKAMR